MSKYLELVQDSFTQEHLDKQENQKPYVAYSIKDDNVIYNIVPKEDGTMYTIYRVVSKDISNCTYNMVDLGLSVKWADRNVGATSPEDFGSYFQWGDTHAYTFDGAGEITAAELAEMLNPLLSPELGMEITKDNVGMILEMMGVTGTDLTLAGIGLSLDKEFSWETYFDTTDGGSTFNKYNGKGGLTVLESSDDAATVHMGANWRMPTDEQIQELMDNTTKTYINLQGNEFTEFEANGGAIENLKGIKLTASNGNSIFIPAAGYYTESISSDFNKIGYYWSSKILEYYGASMYSINLAFTYNGYSQLGWDKRHNGLPVRGVQP